MHAHHRAHLVDTIAACIDDDLAGDVALVCMHGPAVIPMLGEASHGGMTIDFGPCCARTPRERLTELRRVDIAIQRIP